MSARVEIAHASAEDAALLASLHGLCFDEAWSAESFASLLANPRTFALLASAPGSSEVDGLLVAQAMVTESEILTLATAPAARRSGCARALVRAAARNAEALGATEMFLEVAVNNQAAVALYKGLGFAENGRRRGYYETRNGAVDALVLRAALPLA